MNAETTIPQRLQEIIEDFQLSQGREKLELLLEFADSLPPLPAHLQANHDQMEAVPECMTPVFVQSEYQNGKMTFHFDAPPESPTVRGYAAIMVEGMAGATPQQVLNVPNDFYQQMGLDQVLSNQRLNGMIAILAHMKRLAVEALEEREA